jgi:hypothetical protein
MTRVFWYIIIYIYVCIYVYMYMYIYIYDMISLALARKNQVKVEFLWKSSPFLMPTDATSFLFRKWRHSVAMVTSPTGELRELPYELSFPTKAVSIAKKVYIPKLEIEWQVSANSKQPNFFSIATTITVISTSKTVQPLWLLWVLPFYPSPSVVRLPGCVSVVLARLWAAAGRSLRTSFHL